MHSLGVCVHVCLCVCIVFFTFTIIGIYTRTSQQHILFIFISFHILSKPKTFQNWQPAEENHQKKVQMETNIVWMMKARDV